VLTLSDREEVSGVHGLVGVSGIGGIERGAGIPQMQREIASLSETLWICHVDVFCDMLCWELLG